MSQDGATGRHTGRSLAGGRYQLRALLGEGGMAAVHLAYDTALDRQVAIKTLHTELGREQSFRERFRREAQAVAKLSHPNIVSVFDTGEDPAADGSGLPTPYMVMEYVEGQPLGSVLAADVRQYGAMPAEKALRVTADVLAALGTSHEVGLVHRDIKPGNVMVTPRGVVKVMDFGIARALQSGVSSMTQTGMVVGTPQYLSPEQALGRGVDTRSDLYSVGIMLFQLLTGRLPFDADGPLAIVYAHVQEEPVAPSGINRSVTPAMDALVARALRKNPNERFPTAAAMREACERVLAAGRPAAPVIVSGGPPASGAGVASAVFPPVGQGYPAPAYPGTPGPYGPPAPPAHTPMAPMPSGYGQGQGHGYGQGQGQYGYPQGSGGPVPPYQQQPQPGTAGMAPAYTISPPPPSPFDNAPKKRTGKRVALTVGVVLGVLMVIGIVRDVMGSDDEPTEPDNLRNDSAPTAPGPGTRTGGQAGADPAVEGLPPDRNRKIDTEKCTDAPEDTADPAKVAAPDLLYKDVLSVKECLRSAGWSWRVIEVDNPQWSRDAVIRQFPSRGTAVTPEQQEFELHVSTGRAG
ncbi:protein kinase domain-containing protein [Streptomyces yaizuensis]|uniref:Protein kinase n=1 Tax=Streptomyces yaizuensis TaxID=2989713 RepID=A0ABQ5P2C2_9ACTN|nr:protein kinase [Streptomyces sp. YSPA8]GLF96652.1 protein kinase [Streptomyces sp. YSPA8]